VTEDYQTMAAAELQCCCQQLGDQFCGEIRAARHTAGLLPPGPEMMHLLSALRASACGNEVREELRRGETTHIGKRKFITDQQDAEVIF
jgi:hypothetical protein